MKRKLVSFGLILATVVSVASGCSGTKPQSAQGGSGSTPEKITISVGMWPDETDQDNVKMFENYKKIFEAKYPNVTVKPDHYAYAVDTYFAMANAGTAPTIFESWYTEPQKLINNNLIADITPELKAKGWDQYMASNIKTLLTDSKGEYYGLPRDGYALGLMLNLNLFKAAGLMNSDGTANYPKTWDELAQDAVKIKKATGKAGFCLLAKDGSGGWQFSNIAWDFGASLEKQEDGKWKANFDSPEAVAAMKYVYDLKWKYDVLTASPTTVDWANGFVQLGTGNAAMLIGANDAVNQPTTTNGLPAEALSLVPIPAGPSGNQYALMGGTPYLFAKNATPEQITACLNWLEIIGKAPVVSADSKNALEETAATFVKNGTPNIQPFPAWTNQDYIDAQLQAIKNHPNVDQKLFSDYFSFIKKPDALHIEEKADTQDMYSALTKVLQEVVTNKNADVAELMKQANSDFQNTLDRVVNQ